MASDGKGLCGVDVPRGVDGAIAEAAADAALVGLDAPSVSTAHNPQGGLTRWADRAAPQSREQLQRAGERFLLGAKRPQHTRHNSGW